MTSWITRHPDRLPTDAGQQLKEILTRVPALATTAEHVRSFAELMNDRRGRELKDWIARVQQDKVPALRSFAAGLLQDLDAVVAGLSLSYSSGAVEGHNSKIKMLKRQMFGRATSYASVSSTRHEVAGRGDAVGADGQGVDRDVGGLVEPEVLEEVVSHDPS
ncbi:transposase [Kitasatospora sp. NPDC001603]|uniref:transposase n=1 Tax=Kitasatospora sp. NPDC001603 TaxID=3154388 RepID=UPI00332F1E4C